MLSGPWLLFSWSDLTFPAGLYFPMSVLYFMMHWPIWIYALYEKIKCLSVYPVALPALCHYEGWTLEPHGDESGGTCVVGYWLCIYGFVALSHCTSASCYPASTSHCLSALLLHTAHSNLSEIISAFSISSNLPALACLSDDPLSPLSRPFYLVS